MSIAHGLVLAGKKKWVKEKYVVGGLQTLSLGLRPALATFSAPVYYSPAHALPQLPPDVARCITVHDLIPAKFPHWYDEARSFHTILSSIDPHRDTVFATSECTRRDWLAQSGADAALARVISHGVSNLFRSHAADSAEVRRVRNKYGMEDALFLLAVGTLEPRKNLGTLIRAFIRLREGGRHSSLRLLLVGPRGWKNDEMFTLLQTSPEIAAAIHLAGFVPDEDLPGLYSACEVFVYPSRYEGFGLPVAEALKCGAVVVCGDNSSLPEVAGEAAAYANITNPTDLAQVINNLLDDPVRRATLKTLALERSVLFTWASVANAYLDSFSALSTFTAPRDDRAKPSIKT